MAHKNEVATDRRSFLKLASVGTLVGGAVAVTGVSAEATVTAESQGSGYRVTDHVKKVYELSRF